jgi:hypothetical protein
MPDRHRLRRAAAFAASFLLVAWIGGTIGAAGFKVFYWLLFNVWPDTAIHILVPDDAIRTVLALPDGNGLVTVGLFLLRLDILTVILAGPPVFLLPCLAILLANRLPEPLFTRLRPPFAPAPSRNHGLTAPSPTDGSTKTGSATSLPPTQRLDPAQFPPAPMRRAREG